MARSPAPFREVLVLVVAGASLSLISAETAARGKAFLRDLLVPGQIVTRAAVDRVRDIGNRFRTGNPAVGESHDLAQRLETLERDNRRLAALLAAERQDQGESGLDRRAYDDSPPPLLVPQLVEARILGEESSSLWRSRKLIGAGTASGVVESALVLDDPRFLVDLGADARVETGDAVYAGRCVVGKIAEAGRYSSTVQLVTETGYSGRARLARRGPRGLSFGAEATLVGTGGPLCRLNHVHEPVNVGDEVYTGGTDGLLPAPMYYGQVVRAELEPDATEWSIDVEPAVNVEQIDRVRILRMAINPQRILAN